MQDPQESNIPQESQSIEPINHFTVDIETLGLWPDAVVLSVGCIAWNMRDGIIAEFHEALNIDSQENRSVSGSTIQFWIDQPRNFGLDGVVRLAPNQVCSDLFQFITRGWTEKKSTIWAQGPQFDITILEHLFNQYNRSVPWEYNSVRDARTLWKLFPTVTDEDNLHKHNALEDARTETKNVMNILTYLHQADINGFEFN